MKPIVNKRRGSGLVEVWDIEYGGRNVGSIIRCIDRFLVTRRFRDHLEIAGRFLTLQEAKDFILNGEKNDINTVQSTA